MRDCSNAREIYISGLLFLKVTGNLVQNQSPKGRMWTCGRDPSGSVDLDRRSGGSAKWPRLTVPFTNGVMRLSQADEESRQKLPRIDLVLLLLPYK